MIIEGDEMKVLLIFPNAVTENVIDVMAERPPLGLAYLAAVLEREGHKIEILDLNVEKDQDTALLNGVKNADLVGISILTAMYNQSRNTIKKIIEIRPEVPIVVGGPHVTALTEEVLKENKVDVAVRYEGEETILELVNALECNEDLDKIKGIYYKKGDQIFKNQDRPLIKNLDNLPFPARHLIKLDRYINVISGRLAVTMMTSKGCPYRCVYCCKYEGLGWRARSAENVLKEIDEVYHRYKTKFILFNDDTFAFDKQRVIDICNGLIDRKYDLKWICSTRVDTVDKEILEIMKKAGCWKIHFGVESGCPEIIEKIKKGITIKQVKEAFRLTDEIGLNTKAYFILGFPWDTRETVMETIKFSTQLPTDEIQYTVCIPYPGTPLWMEAIKDEVISLNDINWDDFVPLNPEIKNKVFFTKNLSKEEIRSFRAYAYRQAIKTVLKRKIVKRDFRYIYHILKEKKNLGLSKFLKSLILKR